MEQTLTMEPTVTASMAESPGAIHKREASRAFRVLHLAYIVAPIVAGVDKFTGLLVDWTQYLALPLSALVGSNGHAFMMGVGVVEIVAGIGVAVKPRIFAFVVAAWLWGIIINLLMIPGFYDVALRDFGLSLGAVALGLLSRSPVK